MHLPKPGREFTLTPPGQYVGICAKFIDLGTQVTNGQYGYREARKIALAYEVPKVRIEFEENGQIVNRPALQTERFTWSMSTKSNLRPFLESWRGRQFTDQDFGMFDTQNLLGVPALIQIKHSQDGKYADIQSIMMYQAPRDQWPKLESPPTYFSLEPDRFNQQVFDSLTAGYKRIIAPTPEFAQVGGRYTPPDDQRGAGSGQGGPQRGFAGGSSGNGYNGSQGGAYGGGGYQNPNSGGWDGDPGPGPQDQNQNHNPDFDDEIPF